MPMAYQSHTQTIKLWPVLFSHLWSHLSRETTVLIQVIQAQVYNPHLVKLHSIWVMLGYNYSKFFRKKAQILNHRKWHQIEKTRNFSPALSSASTVGLCAS